MAVSVFLIFAGFNDAHEPLMQVARVDNYSILAAGTTAEEICNNSEWQISFIEHPLKKDVPAIAANIRSSMTNLIRTNEKVKALQEEISEVTDRARARALAEQLVTVREHARVYQFSAMLAIVSTGCFPEEIGELL